MNVLKILGGAMAGVSLPLALAGFLFWWGWLRAPSPEAVCDHAIAIWAQKMVVVPDPSRRECLRHAQPPQYGRLRYARAMNCVMAARNAAQLNSCRAGL